MNPVAEEKQNALFDTTGREFNINWIDEKQPLFIANNPLHWKGHKLQILIARLERQAQSNPAQFNSRNYIEAVNELEKVMIAINEGADNDLLDEGKVASDRDTSAAPAVGTGNAPSLDNGISPDNPTAG